MYVNICISTIIQLYKAESIINIDWSAAISKNITEVIFLQMLFVTF